MKFTVDRRTWYRGKESWQSQLLLKNGQRCCIGFVCQQLEIPDKALRVGAVSSIHDDHHKDKIRKDLGINAGEGWLSEAYIINDNPDMSDDMRESRLKALAIENGHEFEFIN